MNDLPMLSEAQIRRIKPYFPLSHGVPGVDDRRVLSGIIYVIKNGLRWCDAPAGYGPHKTLYSRFVRWSKLGVFSQIFAALVKQAGESDVLTHARQSCLQLRPPDLPRATTVYRISAPEISQTG